MAVGRGAAGAARAAPLFELRKLIVIKIKLTTPKIKERPSRLIATKLRQKSKTTTLRERLLETH